jgi:acetolactate synthase-1/2/3 large subunit
VSATRTGAHLVVEALAAAGVRQLFSLSGNQILSVYDATLGSGLSILHTRHEAAAVHMADAWGRLTEEPGVALVTAGPGHCNAISALYGALMSESPVVLLSGHAPTAQLGRGAFQEMDQAAVAAPVCKASWMAKDAARLGEDIATALDLARSGRPGPVHVSLPGDLLEAKVGGGARGGRRGASRRWRPRPRRWSRRSRCSRRRGGPSS